MLRRGLVLLLVFSLLAQPVSAGTLANPEVSDKAGDQVQGVSTNWAKLDILKVWMDEENPDEFRFVATFSATPSETTGQSVSYTLILRLDGTENSFTTSTLDGNSRIFTIPRADVGDVVPGKDLGIALASAGNVQGQDRGSDRAPDSGFGTYVIGTEAAVGMDHDQDGLDDRDEFGLGTDPANPDTDGDGLSDGEEHFGKTSPTDPDSDNDGLNDGAEKTLGTDPVHPDTDRDRVRDGDEVEAGTDPLNPDSDGDGIDDGDERDAGTDPLKADTDGDGLDDKTELDNGLDPTNGEDAGADPDGDGVTTAEELAAGTNPFVSDIVITEPTAKEDFPWLWLIIAFVIVLLIIAVIALLIIAAKRRRQREEEELALLEAELAELEAEEAALDADLEAVEELVEEEPESEFEPFVIDRDYLESDLDDEAKERARQRFIERERRYLDRSYPARRREYDESIFPDPDFDLPKKARRGS